MRISTHDENPNLSINIHTDTIFQIFKIDRPAINGFVNQNRIIQLMGDEIKDVMVVSCGHICHHPFIHMSKGCCKCSKQERLCKVCKLRSE